MARNYGFYFMDASNIALFAMKDLGSLLCKILQIIVLENLGGSTSLLEYWWHRDRLPCGF